MLRLLMIHVSLSCLLATTAAAQDAEAETGDEEAPSASDAEARGLFAAGEAAYAAGRFEDALGHFRRAYELSQRAGLLYNIGLAAANTGDDRAALEAFEQYLAEVTDAPNRSLVEARIEALRRNVAEDEAHARELAAAEERAQQESARADAASASNQGPSTAGWALVIGGGVVLAAGAVLFGVGLGDVSTVEGAPDGTPWEELRGPNDRAPLFTTIGLIAGGVGLAAVATGLTLVLTSGGGSETAVTMTPTGLSVRGVF